MMANGSAGMSGHSFDAFVSSQRSFNDYDLAAKIQEKYWRARQKFLSTVEKKEDTCIVLSDSKLDAKLEIYRSIDKSCARLTQILEDYQNCLYVYSNEEYSFGALLKECSRHDKTKAGKILALTGRSLAQSSQQRIRLYMPLLRIYQEMETFHTRAVEDTSETVDKLEDRRSQYRASLLWMKDISERLDPDIYKQLDRFRRVQNQVRNDKKVFDKLQMDVVQKIDLLMASRCNLMNQIFGSYQAILLETFEKNCDLFKSLEELIKKEDLYDYEFKALKQLNPLRIDDQEIDETEEGIDLLHDTFTDENTISGSKQKVDQDSPLIDFTIENLQKLDQDNSLIDFTLDDVPEQNESKATNSQTTESDDIMDKLEALFGKATSL